MQDSEASSSLKSVIFDTSKREAYHPNSRYKRLQRRLKNTGYKVSVNKEDLTNDRLKSTGHIAIFGAPREKFSTAEFSEIKAYLEDGNSVLITVAEGGEETLGTNVNYLLEEYGLYVQSDAVVRSTYCNYSHPKEALITHGVLQADLAIRYKEIQNKENDGTSSSSNVASENSAQSNTYHRYYSSETNKNKNSANHTVSGILGNSLGSFTGSLSNDANDTNGNDNFSNLHKEALYDANLGGGLNFVYPYGCTISISKPAVGVLTTGPVSYPINRPICGSYEIQAVGKKKGRLMVLGCSDIWSDEWIDREDNNQMVDIIFRWLAHDPEIDLNRSLLSHEKEALISDYNKVPSIGILADRIKPCLQESEELPNDFTNLFDHRMFKYDTSLVPEAKRLYDALGVKHETLTLIPPEFECPLPSLTPAVFPPVLKELDGPALDQYDLDEHIANENIRLAQLTNKCSTEGVDNPEDLEYFVREAGEIAGITNELPNEFKNSPKHILHYLLTAVVRFKKLNVENETENGTLDSLANMYTTTTSTANGNGISIDTTKKINTYLEDNDMNGTNINNLKIFSPPSGTLPGSKLPMLDKVESSNPSLKPLTENFQKIDLNTKQPLLRSDEKVRSFGGIAEEKDAKSTLLSFD